MASSALEVVGRRIEAAVGVVGRRAVESSVQDRGLLRQSIVIEEDCFEPEVLCVDVATVDCSALVVLVSDAVKVDCSALEALYANGFMEENSIQVLLVAIAIGQV